MPTPTTNRPHGPEAEALFDAIWNGEQPGLSRAAAERTLADHEQTLADLHALPSPRRRFRRGGPTKARAVTIAWFTKRIERLKTDLATNGRTNPTNIDNVRHALTNRTTTPA
jgi:hypothetical protein